MLAQTQWENQEKKKYLCFQQVFHIKLLDHEVCPDQQSKYLISKPGIGLQADQ